MFQLSLPEFDILWNDLACVRDYQRPPYPLQIPSVGTTIEERARIRESVYRSFADRRQDRNQNSAHSESAGENSASLKDFRGGTGLRSRGLVGLDPLLVECLENLAQASTYVECEVMADLVHGDDTAEVVRAVIAMDGERASLACQRETGVTVAAMPAAQALTALVSILPAFNPANTDTGVGARIEVPVSALEEHAENPVYFSQGTELGFYHREIKRVRAIQAQPVQRAGQFSVRKRGVEGRVNRAGAGTWFVTDKGGYFGSVRPGAGGDWLSLSAVDATRLTQKLAALAFPAE
jgi:hypothetical protein